MTVEEVIERLLAPGRECARSTPSDALIVGQGQAQVRGIAVTWLATRSLILEAARKGLNLVMSRKPFFHHPSDSLNDVQNDFAFVEKMQDVLKNRLSLLRLDESLLGPRGCGTIECLAGALHLQNPLKQGDHYQIFTVEAQPLDALVSALMGRLGFERASIYGAIAHPVRRMALVDAVPLETASLRALLRWRPDLVLCGEVAELACRFAEDSEIALWPIGTSRFDRPGLLSFTEWLQAELPELQVQFLPDEPAVHRL